MDVQARINAGALEYRISGRMTFNDFASVKDIVRKIECEHLLDVSIDLSGLVFLDSSGMGMLLIIRDATQRIGGSLTINGPQGQVAKSLIAAKMSDLLTSKFEPAD